MTQGSSKTAEAEKVIDQAELEMLVTSTEGDKVPGPDLVSEQATRPAEKDDNRSSSGANSDATTVDIAAAGKEPHESDAFLVDSAVQPGTDEKELWNVFFFTLLTWTYFTLPHVFVFFYIPWI